MPQQETVLERVSREAQERRAQEALLNSGRDSTGMQFVDNSGKPELSLGDVGMDVLRQTGRGLADAGLTAAAGVTDILGFDETAENLRRQREEAREFYGEPETAFGTVAGIGGRAAGEIAMFFTPGSVLNRVAQAGRAARGAVALTRGQKLARSVAAGAALDVPIEIGENPEESLVGALAELTGSERLRAASESDVGRGLGGAVLAGGVGAVLSGVLGRVAKRFKRGAAEVAEEVPTRDILPIEDLAPDRAVRPIEDLAPDVPVRPIEDLAPDPPPVRDPDAPEFVSDVDPSLGDADFDVRLAGIRNDPEAVGAVAERVSRLKEQGVIRNNRTTFKKLAEDAQAVDLDDVLRGDKAREGLDATEAVALKLQFNEDFDELAGILEKLDSTPTQSDTYLKLNQAAALIETRMDAVMSRYIQGSSQSGRNLVALRYGMDKGVSPAYWFTKATRELPAGQVLDSDLRRQITRLLKAGDKEGLLNLISGLRKPLTFRDLAFWTTLRKSGLISAPVSAGRAIVGNTARGLVDTAAKPVAVTIDTVLGLLTNERTTRFGGLSTMRAAARGFREGLGLSLKAIKGDLSAEALEKLELRRGQRLKSVNILGVDPVDLWTQTWFRVQDALDRPFSRVAYRRSIAEQAEVMARNIEGLKGAQAKERIRFLTENPTEEMALRSQIEGQYATFQNESVAGDLARGLRSKVGPKTTAVIDIIQPFSRTPGSIIGQTLETSPLGALASIDDLMKLHKAATGTTVKRSTVRNLQRRAVRRGSRWITGLAGVAWGAAQFKKGNVTGAIPSSPSEREQFLREGKRPFAVRVGGRWVPLTQAQPLAGLIAFGAALAQEPEREGLGRIAEIGERLAAAGGQIALETPTLRGFRDVQTLLGRNSSSTFLERTVASFVPNLMAAAARSIDPGIKEISSLSDAILARIPVLSRGVPNRIDSLTGQEIVREDSKGATALFGAMGVFGSAPDRTVDNPVLDEMQRLGASVGRINQRTDEADEDYRDRTRLYGSIVGTVVNAFLFPTSDDDIELLRTAGVLDEAAAYQTLKRGEQTPEAVEEQRRLLQKIVGDVRSRITREQRLAAR